MVYIVATVRVCVPKLSKENALVLFISFSAFLIWRFLTLFGAAL